MAIAIGWIRVHDMELAVQLWRTLLDDPDLRIVYYAQERLSRSIAHGDYPKSMYPMFRELKSSMYWEPSHWPLSTTRPV